MAWDLSGDPRHIELWQETEVARQVTRIATLQRNMLGLLFWAGDARTVQPDLR